MHEPIRSGPAPRPARTVSTRLAVVAVILGASGAALLWHSGGGDRGAAGAIVESIQFVERSQGPGAVRIVFTRDVHTLSSPARAGARAALQRRWVQLDPPCAGVETWLSGRELLFDSETPLRASFEYTVVLSPYPAALGGPFRYALLTPPPHIVGARQVHRSVSPAGAGSDGAGRALSNAAQSAPGADDDAVAFVRIDFDASVDPAMLPAYLQVDDAARRSAPFQVLPGPIASTADVAVRTGAASLTISLVPRRSAEPDPLQLRVPSAGRVAIVRALRVAEVRGSRVGLGSPSIEVYFDQPLLPELPDLAAHFDVEPSVAFTAAAQWSRVALDGDFQPGATYRVTIRRGLEGAANRKLAEDFRADVVLPHREPALELRGPSKLLPGESSVGLRLRTVNVTSVSVRASRVPPNAIVPSVDVGWQRVASSRHLEPWVYRAPPGQDQIRETLVDLRDLVGADARGVWEIQASPGGEQRGQVDDVRRVVSVSDIAITVKRGSQGAILAWVVSLEGGEPLSGVTVSLLSRTNQLLAESNTGQAGLATFDRVPEDDGPPRLVVASKGPDVAYLELSQAAHEPADFAISRRSPPGAEGEALVIVDPPAYRPGDGVQVLGLLRGHLGPTAGTTVNFEVLRPDGKRVRSATSAVSPAGFVETGFRLSPGAAAGLYRVVIRTAESPGRLSRELGSGVFQVDDRPAPILTVQATASTHSGERDAGNGSSLRRFRSGERVEIIVRASDASGLPASGKPVEAAWTLEPSSFTPRGWESFQFGSGVEAGSIILQDGASGALDAHGEARFLVRLPADVHADATLLRFDASVLDASGRASRCSLVAGVEPSPIHLGLRIASRREAKAHPEATASRPESAAARASGPEDDSFRLECVALDSLGLPAPLETLEARVQGVRGFPGTGEDLWDLARRRVVLGSGRGGLELTFPGPGAYLISVQDPGSAAFSQAEILLLGPGGARLSSLDRADPERLALTLERGAYLAGETVRVTVRAPFPGALLLTTETDAVLHTRVVRVDAASVEAELPLPSDPAAAPYVGATLIRGALPGLEWLPRRARGVAPVPLDRTRSHLTVTLAAPADAAPSSRVPVRVTVTDEEGAPVSGAEVRVWLSDDGDPASDVRTLRDPFEFFFGRRSLEVETVDAFDSAAAGRAAGTRPAFRARGPGTLSVGSEPAGERGLVALHTLRTASDGAVVALIPAPAGESERRIVAVASDGGRFGSAVRPLSVAPILALQAQLPPRLSPGDAFSFSAGILNRTESSGSATLVWNLENFVRDPPEPPDGLAFSVLRDREVHLPARGGSAARVRLIAAKGEGQARVRLDAKLEVAGARFAASRTWEAGLRPSGLRRTRFEQGIVTQEAPLERKASLASLSGTSSCRLVVSLNPAVVLLPALEACLEIPPVDLDTAISRAFPLLVWHEEVDAAGVARAGWDPSGAGVDGAAACVAEGIERVLDLQSPAGWFARWPRRRDPWPWGTVSAVHFLVEARARGHGVPGSDLEAALAYIRDAVVRGDWSESNSGRLEAAYGLLVLALADSAERDVMESLRREAADGKLDPVARFLLGWAFHRAGARESARELVAGPLPDFGSSRAIQGGALSPVRQDALLLASLAEVMPEDERVGALVARLESRRRNGSWGTAADSATVLLALAKVVRDASSAPGEGFALVSAPGGEPVKVAASDLRSFTFDATLGSVKVAVVGPGQFQFSWAETRWVDDASDAPAPELEEPAAPESVSVVDVIDTRRRYLRSNFTGADPGSITLGETLWVEIALEARELVGSVLIEDELPAGLALESLGPESGAPRANNELPALHLAGSQESGIWSAVVELSARKQGVLRYGARAVLRGSFVQPSLRVRTLDVPGPIRACGGPRLIVH